jgi:O-antigen/teichoic acid export membrane protein
LAHQQKNQFSGVAAFRGAMMVTGSTYVTYALGLLTSIVVARTLGPDDFGRYSYVVWLAGMLVMLASNGLTHSAIRFVSESLGRSDPGSASGVHAWLQRRHYACLFLVGVLFVVAFPFTPHPDVGSLGVIIAITLVAGLSKTVYLFDVSVGKGYGRYGIEASANIAVSVVNFVAVLVLASQGAGLVAYLVVFACAGLAYALSARLMLRQGSPAPSPGPLDPVLLPRLRKHLYWSVVLALTFAFTNKSIETYLLSVLAGPAAVGFFAIAVALTRGGIEMLSSGLATVLLPMMAHAYGQGGHERASEIMSSATRYFTCLGLLLAGAGVLVAPAAIHLLYGEAYAAVVLPLQLMIAAAGLTLSEGAFSALLASTDNQRIRVVFVGLSLVVTLVMALLLIPTWGLMGAVVGHAIARVVTLLATAIGVRRVLHMRLPARELALLAAASGLAIIPAVALALLLGEPWGGVPASVLYVVAFLALGVVFGAWRAEDVALLDRIASRYPRLHATAGPWLARWGAARGGGA